MNARQIEIFDRVMAEGSISAAARSLNVSQPSVSLSIKHLEGQLGYALFRRLRGRLQPTPEAVALAQHTAELTATLQRIGRLARNLKGRTEAEITLGVVPALSFRLLPNTLRSFLQNHPGVKVRANSITYQGAAEAITRREVDMALLFAPPDLADTTREIIGQCGLALISEGQTVNALRNLGDHDLISISDSGPVGSFVDRSLADLEIFLKSRVSVENYYQAASLVRHGFGLAIVDQETAVAFDAPITRELPDLGSIDIGIIYRSDHHHQTMLQDFAFAAKQAWRL